MTEVWAAKWLLLFGVGALLMCSMIVAGVGLLIEGVRALIGKIGRKV